MSRSDELIASYATYATAEELTQEQAESDAYSTFMCIILSIMC